MSSERKLLKIICFLYVLDAVANFIVGGIMLAGMGTLSPTETVPVDGINFGLQAWALGFGVWLLASGVVYLVYAALGIRGANTPRKIGPFRVMTVIALIFSILGAIGAFVMTGSAVTDPSNFLSYVSIVFAIVCLSLSGKIKAQAER